jgi:iron uptake system component EfeO
LSRLARFRPRALVLAGLTGFALALAACGGGTATLRPATAPPTGSPVPATAAPPSGGVSAAPSTVLRVQADEYTLTPTSLSAPAGSLTFTVANTGTENHEFEVLSGDQSLGKIEAFPRETTRELSVTLEPGEYTFACRLNGHDVLGMTGTLTVTGS